MDKKEPNYPTLEGWISSLPKDVQQLVRDKSPEEQAALAFIQGDILYPKVKRYLRNRCKCTRCGDIIESTDRHNFVRCECGTIFTDGGLDYLRRGYKEEGDIEDMSVENPDYVESE